VRPSCWLLPSETDSTSIPTSRLRFSNPSGDLLRPRPGAARARVARPAWCPSGPSPPRYRPISVAGVPNCLPCGGTFGKLARGLRVADPGVCREQLQELKLRRRQPGFPAPPEERFAFGEVYEFQLSGGLAFCSSSGSRRIPSTRLTRSGSPLASAVLLSLQGVAEPRAMFDRGVRVEFAEFLEC
jgi:hypothetical protein